MNQTNTNAAERTMAFAGVLQAAVLTHQLARENHYDRDALHESAYSLLRLQAASIEEIFGGARGLQLGLRCMLKLFSGGRDASTPSVLQYAHGCHRLSLQLQNNRREILVISEIMSEIRATYMKHYRNPEHDDDLQRDLSTIYRRCIGRLKSSIVVRGRKTKLEDEYTVYRIRAALFAGIRAAWLWRQLGGRRRRILFDRGEYRREAERLLGEAG